MRTLALSIFVAVLSALLLSSTGGVAGAKVAQIFPGDNYVEGWVRSEKTLRFEKTNLFDYIDGGAELFLEFGFDSLLVQRYEKSNAGVAGNTGSAGSTGGTDEIALEAYRMESPEAALGMYLAKCGEETPVEGVGERNSGDRYQLSIVKGDYFIQVNNFGGNERLLPVMLKLTQRMLASIPKGRPVTLLNRLPKKDFVPGSGFIFRGPYALEPIFTFGKGDVLQLGGKVFGVAGDYAGPDGGLFTRFVIAYPESSAALSAFDNLVNNLDPYLEIVNRWERGFTFRDYRDKFGIVELRGLLLNIEINLPEEPEEPGERERLGEPVAPDSVDSAGAPETPER